jgi:hypothetical protein
LVPEDVGAPGGNVGFPKDGDIGPGPLAVNAWADAATVTDIKKNITIKRHIVVFVLSNRCFFVLILSFFWSILYIF